MRNISGLLLALLCLSAAPASAQSWTFVASAGAEDNASGTTVAAPAITVAAGDLIVVAVKFEGATTTVSVSDGTSSLTQWSKGVTGTSSGEPFLDAFYLTSSVASGSVTYTATLGAARAFKDIMVMAYRPSGGSVSLDGTANVGSAISGTSATSGNTTTTGTTGIAFAPYASYGPIIVSGTINGVTATQFIDGSNSTAINHDSGFGHSALFAAPYAAGFTGQAAATLNSSDRWVLGVIAFKISAGGSPPKRLLTLGVGDN